MRRVRLASPAAKSGTCYQLRTMRKRELLDWFEELDKKRWKGFGPLNPFGPYYQDRDTVSDWMTEARSALGAAFPPRHPVLVAWDALRMGALSPPDFGGHTPTIDSAAGIFDSAHSQLKAGRIGSLIDGAKAETVGELLDQADQLVGSGYLVAAAVLVGGALETHLLHLCQRAGLTWQGHGTIEKYNGAVAQARKAGNEIYGATDGKQVTGWGGLRNDAAHKPGSFTRTAAEVRTMIDGIRQFIGRSP